MTATEHPSISSQMQRVFAFASDAADGFGHGFITCQHLLYGLAGESRGVASAVLAVSGIQASSILSFLEARAATHDRTALSQVNFAAEVEIVLKKGAALAIECENSEVDTEHILSAMLHDTSSADEIFDAFGVSKSQILHHLSMLQQSSVRTAPAQNTQHQYKFSYDSAQILTVATDLARREKVNEVSSLHLILALAICPGKVKSLLERDFSVDSQIWLHRIDDSHNAALASAQPILGKSVQEILGCAIGQAWNRRHLTITPLHIALGIVHADRSEALDLLAESGVSRAELLEVLDAALPPVART